jgi:hypothetical protein
MSSDRKHGERIHSEAQESADNVKAYDTKQISCVLWPVLQGGHSNIQVCRRLLLRG